MMDFDCFKWHFVIFDSGNEYQDIYADLYKLKSDFSGCLCEEKIDNCDYWTMNRPKTRVTSGENWY